jgi:pyruvate/2-oxoglutarate dehydrogenase complex dihydrolipoamide dehydrogenase (E3) component
MALDGYDAIVIGSGQAAGQLCKDLAASGRRTALVERSHLGGTCINEGCTPTKTMVASAKVADRVRRARSYGVQAEGVRVDMAAVRRRKRDIVRQFGGGLPEDPASWGDSPNLELIVGSARFTTAHEVSVTLRQGGERRLSAREIFVNAGCRPQRPPIPGLEDVHHLDSTSVMELDEVPEHLVVLGGGTIGLEFAQMFRRFGSRVSVVHRGEHLLSREDEDVAREVASLLREDGIDVMLRSGTRRVERRGREVVLHLDAPEGVREIAGSHLLVAVGRVPNTDGLGLDAAGIRTDERGFIRVNERLETDAPGVWALGDVKGGPAFTHVSYDDYRIVAANLLEGGSRTSADRMVPYVVFIDPQLGRVGMTEAEARRSGRKVRIAKMGMDSVPRALEMGESRGFIKAVVDAESEQVLGAAVLGLEGGEIMAMLEIAMMGRLPYTALRDGVFTHPTLAECLNTLFYSFDDDTQ